MHHIWKQFSTRTFSVAMLVTGEAGHERPSPATEVPERLRTCRKF